jgi:hypothetical protein
MFCGFSARAVPAAAAALLVLFTVACDSAIAPLTEADFPVPTVIALTALNGAQLPVTYTTGEHRQEVRWGEIEFLTTSRFRLRIERQLWHDRHLLPYARDTVSGAGSWHDLDTGVRVFSYDNGRVDIAVIRRRSMSIPVHTVIYTGVSAFDVATWSW